MRLLAYAMHLEQGIDFKLGMEWPGRQMVTFIDEVVCAHHLIAGSVKIGFQLSEILHTWCSTRCSWMWSMSYNGDMD